MLDMIIRGGNVIDGSGAPARRADVGIRDGRIAAIGTIDEPAREEIDATGLVVAPGFVDVHTHYDAQAFWDRTLSPSCYHGVTTVIAGNCGFSIAPLNGNPEDSEYLMRMLARVEGMPLESLREGVPWNWRSFGDYLDALDGKLAINAGFMVGHSALRRYVMGARAVGSQATEAEIAAMQQLLRESIAAGGLGFSSTVSQTHNDGDGKPVPSRHATDEELFALAGVVKEFPGTILELLPGVGSFSEDEKERMTKFALAGERTVNWNLLNPSSLMPDMHKAQLAASDHAAARGATVVALTLPQPMTIRLNLVSGFIFDALPGWAGGDRQAAARAQGGVRRSGGARRSSRRARARPRPGSSRRWRTGRRGPSTRPSSRPTRPGRARRSASSPPRRARRRWTRCSISRCPRTCAPPSCRRSSATTTSPGACAARCGPTRAP